MTKRILVYEYMCGGVALGATPADQQMLRQGVAMRDAIVADLLRVDGVSVSCVSCDDVDRTALPVGVQRMCAHGDELPFDVVRREAARHDGVWVVAPETGRVLARLCEAVGSARWIGCDIAAIRLASSKRATAERLKRYGVDTPSAGSHASTSRWVVKPDDGAGAIDTRIHATLEEARSDLAHREQRGAAATLEPWIDGEPLSLSLLCAGGRTELLSVNRQRIRSGPDGWLRFVGVDIAVARPSDPRLPALRGTAARVAEAIPGLRGYVGIDLVWHWQRGPVVVEVNPRVTSAYVGLSGALRRSLGAEVLAMFETQGQPNVAA
jgi:predicted ATP-grasp superfamily ATP-dependent carboligase